MSVALDNQAKAGSSSSDLKSSEDADFEAEAFERNEKRNWSLELGSRTKFGGFLHLRINPVSFFVSTAIIWGFAIWCIVDKDNANADLADAQQWVTDSFTWLYMGTQQVWLVFLIFIYFSRFGNLKLGKPDDEPDFPAASWFMMMFSAGIGIGLFFFGVAEPIFHYESCYPPFGPFSGVGSACQGNRYANLPDDERAQWAMNITYFHWGVHAWVVYVVVGLLLGLLVFRQDLPMTMKSTFHPLIGDKIFGWMGDVVDIISVATTLFGVCTTLGLGVMQLNEGIARLNSSVPIETDSQVIIIWCITAIATVSVVSGVKVGIRRLSEINWVLAQFICFVCFFQDNTWYLLNNFVQSIGFYLQWIIQLGLFCDTFAQGPTESTSDPTVVSGVISSAAPDGMGAERTWMNDWTIFYWGWWIAWAPFVGMFIAKISRGRTIRQFINGAMTGPVLYGFIWFAIFGGIGLRIERQAANLGVTCALNAEDEPIYFREINTGTVEDPIITNEPLAEPVVTIDGTDYWRLSCRTSTQMWFDMLTAFPAHHFYWALSVGSLILYFVTSSDSGSLVIDCLTANGNPHPPVLQRIFWSCTEGAVATALLLAGGEEALSALRAVSIIAGLPYTFMICFMCKALWDVCDREYRLEHGLPLDSRDDWSTGLLDCVDSATFHLRQCKKVLLAVVAPWYYAGSAVSHVTGVPTITYQIIYAVLFYAWLILLIANTWQAGLWAIAWTSYMAFSLHLGFERYTLRSRRELKGSLLADIVLAVLLYPFVAVQMYDEVDGMLDNAESASATV